MNLEKITKKFTNSEEEKEKNYEYLLTTLKETNKSAYKRTKKLNRIYNLKKFFNDFKKNYL
jgi:hypothetical protein